MRLDNFWLLGFFFCVTLSVSLGKRILSPRDYFLPRNELIVYNENWSKASELNKHAAKKSTELHLAVQSNWEQLLLPMPTTVALLGQLMILSTAKNFNLQTDPKKPFQFIKYPSFRAALVQVTNECWNAFHIAHKNMGAIRLSMSTLPGLLKQSMHFITNGSPNIIQKYLPIPINALVRTTQDSANKAVETEKAFIHVMHLLGEVLEVATDTDSQKSIKLEEIKIQLKVAEEEKRRLEEREAFMKEEFSKLNKQLDADRAAFDKAMRSIPKGWKAVFQNFVQDIGTILSLGMGSKNVNQAGRSELTKTIYEDQILSKIGGNFFNIMKDFIEQIDNWIKTVAEKNAVNTHQELVRMNAVLTGFKNIISSKTSSKWFGQFNSTLENAITVISKALEASKNIRGITEDILNFMKSEIEGFMTQIEPMIQEDSKLDTNISSGQMGANEQGVSQMCSGRGVASGERCEAMMRKNQLQQTEKRYDQMFERIMDENKEMTKFLLEISRMDMSKIEITEILELLKKGIEKLSEIRAQWNDLVQFFDTLALHARSLVDQRVRIFVEYVQQLDGSKEELAFMKGTLLSKTEQIFVSAHYIYVLSDSYMQVSEGHLMGALSMLPKLVTILDETLQSRMLEELRQSCKVVQDQIVQNAKIKKAKFNLEVELRMKEITEIFRIVGDPLDGEFPLLDDLFLNSAIGKQIFNQNSFLV